MPSQEFCRNSILFLVCLVAMASAKDVTLQETQVSRSTPVAASSLNIPWSRSISTTVDDGISSTTVPLNLSQLMQVRRNIIRGSNSAVTITKRKYLKKEMCKSAPLHQTIRHRGCRRRVIVNRSCYGQCNSFYIPKTVPRDNKDGVRLEENSFKSCSFCRPKSVRWVRVLLQCPRNGVTTTVRKKIQMVVQCACTALPIN